MTNSKLLQTLEKITAAQRLGQESMSKRQEESLTRQLITALVDKIELVGKIEMTKGDKGERGERGFPGQDGKTIIGGNGERGERGERGDKGEPGKDGEEADYSLVKPIAKEVSEKVVKDHEKNHDHNLIHEPKMLGTLELNEESLKEGAILQIQGNKLVAIDLPSQQARAAGSSFTSRYRLKTVTESTTVDPLDQVVHVDATAGDITLTLYAAEGNEGSHTFFKRIDTVLTNTVTFATPNSETIDFDTLYRLVNTGSGAEIYTDAVNFFLKHS